jgi:DNA-binding NarL/FixJ family response regulator
MAPMTQGCKTTIRAPVSAATLRDLSPRELEVLELMAAGRTNQSIAGELSVSPHTIGTHVKHIFRKLGLAPTDLLDRRVSAVLAYLRENENHG